MTDDDFAISNLNDMMERAEPYIDALIDRVIDGDCVAYELLRDLANAATAMHEDIYREDFMSNFEVREAQRAAKDATEKKDDRA